MGALIETPGIYPGMSAYDNMKCRAICLGITDYDSNIKELLELVSLPTTILRPVKKFSLGMKQRLGIALALLGNPDLLVLDEPINGLDPQGIAEIRETLVKLNKEKKITILISSHILEELSKIVTDYGIIKDGRLIEEISREELMEKCMERIELKTNNSDKATTVIEKMGITNYKVVDKDTIHIYECLDNLGEINKMLVNNDILVTSMKINSESIESYFIELTGK
jgi:ABC-2 type transport system ATP-binding protein